MRSCPDRPAVICAGRIYCDLVFSGLPAMPCLGQEVYASGMNSVLGGGAFIAAAHLQALGRRAILLSRFGMDPVSMALESQFAVAGLDMALVERHADAGPQITVVMAHGDDRAFLSRRAGSALPMALNAALSGVEAAHLHIAEFATLADHPDLVRLAKRHGMSVSLDPSWDSALIHSSGLLSICAGVDLFLPNLEEARAITGHTDAASALNILAQHFPVVALKLGAEGAIYAKGTIRQKIGAPKVAVVDTTGAGDAFNAGFIHAWLDGEPAQQCLSAAVALGSRSVQGPGGTAALSLTDPAQMAGEDVIARDMHP
ncbi:sugar kinase [Devosia algicola]|uniref:Sugar kinase n=1 Tax=Devosia algicola TaxID=3026418 RepID=A0ABY7YK65_9HYPH|nr:sugar kinase [Devosia algicola]WDR01558.1 sugar kinase [Devosia algicola]